MLMLNFKNKNNAKQDKFTHPNSPRGAQYLQKKGYPVVFVFLQPNEPVPQQLIQNKNVLILDLDMGNNLPFVIKNSASTFLIDHHYSTYETIKKYSVELSQYKNKFSYYYDDNKKESAATLTWKVFYSQEIPPLVQIVRIGDTWSYDDNPELYPRYVLKSLYLKRAFRSFPEIEDTYLNWNKTFNDNVAKGETAWALELSYIKKMAKQTNIGLLETADGKKYVVAYTDAPVLHSEVGASIKWYAQKRFKIHIHFSATWKYAAHKALVSVSLRDPEFNLNLATISQNIKNTRGIINYGGGHETAAGFSFLGIENFHKVFQPISSNDLKILQSNLICGTDNIQNSKNKRINNVKNTFNQTQKTKQNNHKNNILKSHITILKSSQEFPLLSC
jgi:hypothetical protein